jgi:hypothetical protein
MAVGAFTFTDPGYLAVRKGTIDLENDTIVAVLVDTAHTPALTEDTYSDFSANECASADYTSNHPEGLTVTGLTWTQTSSRNFKLDGNILNFGDAVTIAARYVYLVRRAGATLVAGDLVVGYMDLNDGGSTNVSSTNGDFDVDWNAANGLFTETVS